MEILRRILLGAGVVAALWMYYYAHLPTLVTIGPAEDAEREVILVSGAEWETFLDEVKAGMLGEGEFAGRTASNPGASRSLLFFGPEEGPLQVIADQLAGTGETKTLLLLSGPDALRFDVRRWTANDSDFIPGEGLRMAHPPTAFFRPLREFAPVAIFLTLVLYALLPWPRRDEDLIRFSRYRVVRGDLIGTLLFALFFGLPLAIVGGSRQALLNMAGGTALFWTLSFFGILILRGGAWASIFAIRIAKDALLIREIGGFRKHPFAGMIRARPMVKRPPKMLSLVSVLTGHPSATGAAVLRSFDRYQGILIEKEEGGHLLLWTSEAGGRAMKGAEKVLRALRAAGIPGTEGDGA